MSATHSMAATAEMAVPFVRLDRDDPELLEELLAEVRTRRRERARSPSAPYVEDFEADFATYCEADEAVGVASGTDALALALRALGIGAGDEVIVPGNTFIATAEAVSIAGATPRFVDVDPHDRADHGGDRRARPSRPKVKAVIPVHLYGATVDMDPLLEVARAARIAVIEDACQAHGARYRGRRVGSLGDVGCFSFYPTKNLGAWGDGGAVVTNRPELADRVRLLRSHGERPRYRHRIVGTTARLDALQAAILRVKLRHLDSWNAHRRRAAAELRRALQGTCVKTPAGPVDGGDHVYHLFVVRTDDRDPLRAHLTASGIASAVHYPVPDPPHGGLRAARLRPGSPAGRRADGRADLLAADLPRHRRRPDQRHRRGGGRPDQQDERLRGDLVAMRSDIVDFAALARGPQIIGKHRQDAEPLGVAVVGYGYWGPNLVRNVIERPEFELRTLCEHELGAREPRSRRSTPASTCRPTSTTCCATRKIDAVIVATPPRTHHAIVKAALEAGKHVLVEKPLATTSADAIDLVDLARRTAAWC